jgi:hypothetical protein
MWKPFYPHDPHSAQKAERDETCLTNIEVYLSTFWADENKGACDQGLSMLTLIGEN